MRMIRNALMLGLGLSVLSGCPGHMDLAAWDLPDSGTSALNSPPTTPYVPPPPAVDGGMTQTPVTPANAAVTPVTPTPQPDAGMVAAKPDAGTTPVADAGNGGGTPVCATAAEIAGKILTPKCGACHGKTSPAAGLDLVTPDIKARLLNIPARGCAGKILVTTTAGVDGYFFDKLVGSVSGCGGQMPFGSGPLSVQEIDCLKGWIGP